MAIELEEMISLKEEEKFRYKLMLKLLFSMMFATLATVSKFIWSREDWQLIDTRSGGWRIISFVILTMDTKEPVPLSHQFRSAIKQFDKDPDVESKSLDDEPFAISYKV